MQILLILFQHGAVNDDHFITRDYSGRLGEREKADVATLLEMMASTMLHLLCRIMTSPVNCTSTLVYLLD